MDSLGHICMAGKLPQYLPNMNMVFNRWTVLQKLQQFWKSMMVSLNGNIFHIIGPLWGESTSDQWIPLTKASDEGLRCFLWSTPKQTVEKTIERPVISDAIELIMT